MDQAAGGGEMVVCDLWDRCWCVLELAVRYLAEKKVVYRYIYRERERERESKREKERVQREQERERERARERERKRDLAAPWSSTVGCIYKYIYSGAERVGAGCARRVP